MVCGDDKRLLRGRQGPTWAFEGIDRAFNKDMSWEAIIVQFHYSHEIQKNNCIYDGVDVLKGFEKFKNRSTNKKQKKRLKNVTHSEIPC